MSRSEIAAVRWTQSRLQMTSRFQRGFASTLLFDFAARGVSALTTVILIRFLALGAYAFIVVFLAVGQFAGSAATGGLRVLYVRTEAERVARGSSSVLPFGAVLVGSLLVIAALAVAGAAIAEIAHVGPAADRLPFVALCAVFSAGQATVDLVTYHYQASLGFVRGGRVALTRNVLLLVAAVLVSGFFSTSKVAVAAALAAASAGAAFLAAGNVLIAAPQQRRLRATRLGFSAESGWLTIYSFVAAGFATVDVFVVAIILSARDVATFGAAQRYYAIALGVVPALEAVLRVRTSQPDIVDSVEAQVSAMTGWLKRAAAPACIALFVLAIAARPLISWLNHGKYPGSVPVFQILLVGVFAYYLAMPAVSMLMAQRRFRLLAASFGAAFVLNAAGDFAVGPAAGITGVAVVATVVLIGLSALNVVAAMRPATPLFVAGQRA
jgi:O-antigen/teichoic acid export membrane protein